MFEFTKILQYDNPWLRRATRGTGITGVSLSSAKSMMNTMLSLAPTRPLHMTSRYLRLP